MDQPNETGADSAPAPPAASGRRRSGGTAPTDDEVAAFSAARGFLLAEWFGAVLMVASFTFLYLLPFAAGAGLAGTYTTCALLLAIGSAIYLRSRRYYQRIGADIAPRMHAIAAFVAGSAGIFWLLFLLLIVLTLFGVPLL
ncbi:MAG: hypothetical protein AABY18_06930 [Candidatus Thermoplasmatota archaeon]